MILKELKINRICGSPWLVADSFHRRFAPTLSIVLYCEYICFSSASACSPLLLPFFWFCFLSCSFLHDFVEYSIRRHVLRLGGHSRTMLKIKGYLPWYLPYLLRYFRAVPPGNFRLISLHFYPAPLHFFPHFSSFLLGFSRPNLTEWGNWRGETGRKNGGSNGVRK